MKVLPNMDPDGVGDFFASSACAGSGLKVLPSLNGVDPNRPPAGLLSCFGGKAVSVDELPPNGLPDGFEPPPKTLEPALVFVPLPNTLEPVLFPPAELNPPCFAKLAKPPEAGAAELAAALPNGLWVPVFFAKLAKPPDWPVAALGDPALAQGEAFAPSWDD